MIKNIFKIKKLRFGSIGHWHLGVGHWSLILLIAGILFLHFAPVLKVSAAPWAQTFSSWSNRKQLTLVNNSGQPLYTNTTYQININTKGIYDSGPSALKSSCDDLRILYQPSDTIAIELPRSLTFPQGTTNCSDSNNTLVTFPLQANITNGSSSSSYYIYYGNPSSPAYSATTALSSYDIPGTASSSFVAPFNGSTTAIASGSGTPTTATGAIRYSGTKTAMSFDGNDYISITDNDNLDGYSKLTLDLWIYPQGNETYTRIIRKGVGSYDSAYELWYTTADKIEFDVRTGNGNVSVTSSTSVNKNVWTHVSGVWDGGTMKIYINGILDNNSGSQTGTMVNDGHDLQISGINDYREQFIGLMDEVRISNSVRYSSNFTPQTSPFVRDVNTKLLFHFDENGDDPRSANTAFDDSGNGNNGTITGAKYVAGLVGVDGDTSNVAMGQLTNGPYASHQGIFIEEGTTNKITNPSFENSTFNTNWATESANLFKASTPSATFTPSISKRNSAGPFAAGVLLQGKSDGTGTSDVIAIPRGAALGPGGDGATFRPNFTYDQGSILFWVTPEWNGNDGIKHCFADLMGGIRTLCKETNNKLRFDFGWSKYIEADISGWTAGSTHLVLFRWDILNKISADNFISLTIDNSTTFNLTSNSDLNNYYGNADTWIGADGGSNNPANAIIEGLTVYRRPLYEASTPSGINVGNGDEISQIYNSGTGRDPTLITGSWDVVFALPTNASTGSLGVGDTGTSAWSHPHASNLLYTSTTNTGGFMMNGTYGDDGWTDEGTPSTVAALDASEKIYSGGYKTTSDAANEGIYYQKTVTAGSNFVIRGLAHSDGTAVPRLILYDQSNGEEIGHLDGSSSSTRSSPSQLIFTGTAPTGQAEGYFFISGNPGNGNTVTVDGQAYTFKDDMAGTPGAGEIWVSTGTWGSGAWSLYLALLGGGSTSEVKYGSGTGAHPTVTPGFPWTGEVTIYAKSAGAGGNGITISENANNVTVSGATLTGGKNACTSIRVKLVNTQNSGTAFWHQVELLSNIENNPSLEKYNAINIPYFWEWWGGTPSTEIESTIVHSGSYSTKYLDTTNNAISTTSPGTQSPFMEYGTFAYNLEANAIEETSSDYYLQSTTATNSIYSSSSTGSWEWLKSVRRDGGNDWRRHNINNRSWGSGYIDDIYAFPLDLITLTVTPASNANSQEIGTRVDGRDTLVQTNNSLSRPSGTISFKYTPRHSAADAVKFVEDAGSNAYIAELYGDSDDYIRLYWSAANTITLAYSMNGTAASSTWDATSAITAGTPYNFEISYTGGSTMLLKVNMDTKITLSSIPAAFGARPTIAYWGSSQAGTQQGDAVFNAPLAINSTVNTTSPYVKFGTNSARLIPDGATDVFITSVDPDSTATHTLSAYVYDGTSGNVGGTVDATIVKLYWEGNPVTTTYTDMGGGWWRLTYSAATTDSLNLYGIQVMAGKTVYVDGFQLEAKAYSTTYCDGSLGSGYAWDVPASPNNSPSTRTAASLKYSGTNNANASSITEAFWIKPNLDWRSIPEIGWGRNAIISIIGGNKDNDINTIYLAAKPDGNLQFVATDPSGAQQAVGATNFTYTQNKWHYMVLTWQNSTKTIQFSLDGSAFSSATNNSMSNIASFANITVGSGQIDVTNTSSDSTISDLRIYDSVLSQTQVSDLYYAGLGSHSEGIDTPRFSGPADPALYWKLDEGSGTLAKDSSLNKNDGTITGAAWQTSDLCLTGKCLKFDGSDDKITDPFIPTNTIKTASFWVRPMSNTASLLQLSTGAYITAASGTITATGFDTPTYYVNGIATTTPTLTANQWNHIEVTTDTGITANAILVGSANSGFTNGFFDEIKLYDYALTAAQAKGDYNSLSAAAAKGSAVSAGGTKQTVQLEDNNLSQGLVGYWRMDEPAWTGSAGEVIDASGNGNNGTRFDNATTASGKFGNGGTFDGTGDYLQLTSDSNSLKPTSTLTISSWVKPADVSTWHQIVTKRFDESNDPYNSYILTTTGEGAANKWDFCISNGTNGSQTCINDPDVLVAGSWLNVTGTYDGSTMRLFVNGVLKKEGKKTGNIGYSNIPLRIGAATSAQVFKGSLDDIRIYNRALSPAEVRQLYDWAPGPVAHWKFEEASGTTANDSSSYGNTGTLGVGNSAPSWTDGKIGKALNFDGSNDYIQRTDTTSLDIPGSVTLSAWVKPTSLQNYATIISKRDVSETRANYALRMGTGATNDELEFYYANSGWQVYTTSNANLTAGSWYYLTASYDGTTVKIYKNGALLTGSCATGTCNTSMVADDDDLSIGKAGEYEEYFSGSIDDVKIYNYTRTQKQIISDMAASDVAVSEKSGNTSNGKIQPAVAYYDFDEGQGATVHNSGSAGPSYNGSISGATWTNDGKYAKALSFDGGDAVTSTITDPAYSNTISLWVFPKTSAANKTVITNLTTNGDSKPVYGNCTGTALSLNTWTHVVAVSNGSGICKIYQNGRLTSSSTSGVTYGTTLNIGASSFVGIIDDVRIYNYPLTLDEALAEYNRSSPLVLGSLSTDQTAQHIASNSASALYCIPGDTASCLPPVAEWKFEEGKNDTCSGGSNDVCDTSGNGNDGAWNGTGKHWAEGKIGKGGSLNGTDDYVSITPASTPDFSAGISVSLWIYQTSPATSGIFNMYVPSYGFNLWMPGGVTYNTLRWEAPSGPSFYSTVPIYPNRWYHLEGTYNPSTTQSCIYVNNVATCSNGSANMSISNISIQLGNYYGTFPGKIDHVRIFNYARTPAQIAWDYNKGAPIAQYDFDECQGTDLHDSSGLGNTGTITIGGSGTQDGTGTCTDGDTGNAWYNGASGKYGSSLNFDGSDDYVRATNSTNNSSLTICGWFKYSSGVVPLSLLSSSTDNWDGWYLSSGNGVWAFNAVVSNSFGTGALGPNVRSNQWDFVCGVVNSSTNRIIYVNGIAGTTDTSSINPSQSDQKVGLGASVRQSIRDNFYSGQIDDVRIYNYALNPTQVKTLYNQNSAVRFGP